jgi:hypothetical protein
MNEDKLNISEGERKFLCRFEKIVKKIYIYYILTGLSLGAAIVGLIVGIELDRKGGFLIAIIFAGIAADLFFLSYSYQKLYSIINKMKQYIKKLEKSVP